MTDYISRQAAIDGKISIQRANGVEIYTDEAVPVEHLKNVPAADVVPVVHGEWVPQDHNKRIGCATTAVFYYPKCSACGHNGNYDMHYCPNCGAKMDGERKE